MNRWAGIGAALIMLVWLGAAIKIPLGVSVDQATLGYTAFSWGTTQEEVFNREMKEKGYSLFVVPFLAEAVWYKIFGTGETQLRVLGWVVQTGLVYGIFRLVRGNVKNRVWPVLIAVTSPWLLYLTMWHLPEAITLAAIIAFVISRNQLAKKCLWLVVFLSSLTGLFAGAVIWINEVARELKFRNLKALTVWLGMGLAVVILMILPNNIYLKKAFEPTLITKLSVGQLAKQVDETQKLIFLAANRQYLLPSGVRKILYNKPGFFLQLTLTKLVSLWDFEQLTAPLSAWVLTGMSGLPPKGHLNLLYFWEIPILLSGFWFITRKKLGNEIRVLFWCAVIPAMILEKKYFHLSAVAGLPLMVWLIAKSWDNVDRKVLRWLVFGLYLLGSWQLGRLVWTRPFDYRPADGYLYRVMYEWVAKNKNNYAEIMVTDKFGPSPLMFAFYGIWEPDLYWRQKEAGKRWSWEKVIFGSFELKGENKIPARSAWLGLPGEFAQVPEEKLTKIPAGDELVYRYGAGLWILENLQSD